MAKHRNGGLDNIRLKFIGHLGKFDNLDDFSTPFEFHSKMNEGEEEAPFSTGHLPSTNGALGDGSVTNTDDEVPF